MNEFKIHIVEDDKWYSELLKHHLELNPEYNVRIFQDGETFLKSLNDRPNVVCLDYSIPDINGADLLKKIKSELPDTSVIIISGQDDVGTAISLLRSGAYDYLIKDENTKDRLWKTIINIRESDSLKKEVKQLKKEVGNRYSDNQNLIGASLGMQKVKILIKKASQVDITVSVTGETGTGKEVVAKSIHYTSRVGGLFVAVNVAAIPRDLIESELFGHEKGAFTGADSRRIGKFEEANGGTLFLDEIGEMDPAMQSRLLRALQEREIVRLGSNKTIPINARIITATHRNLADEVNEGNFREDLYYRLIGLPIELPPLRERATDIKVLANYFLENFASENKAEIKKLSGEATQKLSSYPYPGNVRELKAIIDLAAVMTEGDIIEAEDITFHSSGPALTNIMNDKLSLKAYMARIVQHYLDENDKNVLAVARKLQVGKSTIYRMIQNREVAI
ncbi:sigma-54-dependent Fis family transcriptional regulator [Crocinitomix catalasitica]|nr:sigma-54-dependent Fis family transcriptional regulator [Crocinitomix catalasitica]